MNKMWIVVSICLFLPLTGCTQNKNKIPYCANTQTTETENSVIQKLVPSFAKEMGCEAGSNCLLKWNDHASEKFSIAWKNRCGPVINGVYQLGDEGRGSTFVCEHNNNQEVCCWPLGYDQFKQCSH